MIITTVEGTSFAIDTPNRILCGLPGNDSLHFDRLEIVPDEGVPGFAHVVLLNSEGAPLLTIEQVAKIEIAESANETLRQLRQMDEAEHTFGGASIDYGIRR